MLDAFVTACAKAKACVQASLGTVRQNGETGAAPRSEPPWRGTKEEVADRLKGSFLGLKNGSSAWVQYTQRWS